MDDMRITTIATTTTTTTTAVVTHGTFGGCRRRSYDVQWRRSKTVEICSQIKTCAKRSDSYSCTVLYVQFLGKNCGEHCESLTSILLLRRFEYFPTPAPAPASAFASVRHLTPFNAFIVICQNWSFEVDSWAHRLGVLRAASSSHPSTVIHNRKAAGVWGHQSRGNRHDSSSSGSSSRSAGISRPLTPSRPPVPLPPSRGRPRSGSTVSSRLDDSIGFGEGVDGVRGRGRGAGPGGDMDGNLGRGGAGEGGTGRCEAMLAELGGELSRHCGVVALGERRVNARRELASCREEV